jgi:outer membrane protein
MSGNLVLGAFVAPTAASFARATVQLGRLDARNPGYANRSGLAGLQYVREFKGGLTVGVAPSITRIVCDQRLAAFDAVRKDTQVSAQASLLDRRLDFHGLTPKLLYTYTRNSSKLPLYRFNRSRFDLVLTNNF